jgi:hypothetical protein
VHIVLYKEAVPGDNVIAIFCIILSGEPELDQLAIVAGNKIIADAKIAGNYPCHIDFEW